MKGSIQDNFIEIQSNDEKSKKKKWKDATNFNIMPK